MFDKCVIAEFSRITPNDSGRTQWSSFCGKKSEAIPQKLRSVERSTIAKQSVLLVFVRAAFLRICIGDHTSILKPRSISQAA